MRQHNTLIKGTTIFIILICAGAGVCIGQDQKLSVAFYVVPDRASQVFHVTMTVNGFSKDTMLVKMPAWTPGYYQLLHFADNVSGFSIQSADGKETPVVRSGRNGWKFPVGNKKKYTIQYDVKATRAFVATPYLDADRGYISPTGVFMYISGYINCAASVEIKLPDAWTAATGLTPTSETGNQFSAADFDELYDSPIL